MSDPFWGTKTYVGEMPSTVTFTVGGGGGGGATSPNLTWPASGGGPGGAVGAYIAASPVVVDHRPLVKIVNGDEPKVIVPARRQGKSLLAKLFDNMLREKTEKIVGKSGTTLFVDEYTQLPVTNTTTAMHDPASTMTIAEVEAAMQKAQAMSRDAKLRELTRQEEEFAARAAKEKIAAAERKRLEEQAELETARTHPRFGMFA